jgi:hypothetical protein
MDAVKKRRCYRFFTVAEKHFFACWCSKFDWCHPGVFMTAVTRWLVYAFLARTPEINLCLLQLQQSTVLFLQLKYPSYRNSMIFWWQLCH